MAHTERWEQQRANKPQDYETRSFPKIEQSLTCSQCGKTCRTADGLGIHTKRLHNKKEPVLFPCPNCTKIFKTENTRINHQKSCYGEYSSGTQRTCTSCNKSLSRKNFARHRKRCQRIESPANLPQAREYKAKYTECPDCTLPISATNLARHRNTCRGQPRGERTPSVGGES